MAYAFDFIDQDGRVDHFDLGVFADDAAAERAAEQALADSSTAVCVEVWNGERKVARIQNLLPLAR